MIMGGLQKTNMRNKVYATSLTISDFELRLQTAVQLMQFSFTLTAIYRSFSLPSSPSSKYDF